MQDLYHQTHDERHQESLVARASVRQPAVYLHCLTHRLLSSSFLWLIESYKVIPKRNYILRSLWVTPEPSLFSGDIPTIEGRKAKAILYSNPRDSSKARHSCTFFTSPSPSLADDPAAMHLRPKGPKYLYSRM